MASRFPLLLFAGAVFIFTADPALSQGSDNALDRVVELYRTNARAWEATLGRFALSLFWLLAGIEFTFAALTLVWRKADFSEWLSEIVTQILFIGFFLALLTNASAWAGAIVNSFRSAATAAAQSNGVAAGLAPSDIFDVGIQVAGQFVSATSLWSPAASLGLLISGLLIIFCFALITAFMVAALVESYVVISAGVLFMGFGGSRWTKNFAVKIFTYAVSVGAKLFVLQLVVAIGAQIFRTLASNVQTSNESLFVIIGTAIVMLAITKTVPEMVQALINGTSFGGGGSMLGTATGAAAGAAAGVIGGGMLVHGAGKLASAQLAEAEAKGTAPRTALGRAASWTKNAAKNIAGSTATNVGDRLSGRASRQGNRMAQAGQAMREKAKAATAVLKDRGGKTDQS